MSHTCPPELKRLYRQGRVLPFVGAGVSMSVSWLNADGKKVRGPSWGEMVNEAARSLGLLDESTARGRLLDALAIPAAEPSPDWFLDILTSAAPPWGLPQRGAGRPPDDTVLRGNRPDGW